MGVFTFSPIEESLFQIGARRFGLAQWSLVNPVRSGRKQR